MEKILSLTNDINVLSIFKKKKIICFTDIPSLDTIGKKNIFFLKKNIPNKKKVQEVYSYCENNYNIIFKDLFTELNKLHNLKKSARFWEIIVGGWLRDFIYTCHRNYNNFINVLKNHNFSEYIALNEKDCNLCTANTMEAIYASNDNKWNFALNSKILAHLNVDIKPIFINPSSGNFRINLNGKKKITKKIFSFIKNNLLKIFNFLEKLKEQNILIYSTNLPYLSERMLELSLKQIPKHREEKKELHSDFNLSLRNKIFLKKKIYKDKFEIFLRSQIPYAIPIFAVESFKKNYHYCKKIGFPKKPKFIFTCYAYQTDELFKLYLADQVEKKTKYFCGQHGNNYFTAYQLSLSIELRTCDKFLSWGYKDNKKVVPFFNFNLVNKIGSRRFFDKSGNLLIICSKVGSNISPIDRSRVDINAIEDTLEIVKKLKNHISKNLIIRLEDNYIKFFSEYYYNRYFSKTKFNIDLKKKNLRDLQKKSRLNLFNYYSTGMLENFLLNIPSICYLQKDFEYQNDFFQKKVKYLVDANIVFYDKKKLLNHITKIWNNVDDWWFSEKTQKQIDKFNNDFNFGSNNYDKLRIFFNNAKI